MNVNDKLITPVDGLRLPEAITVKFGPAELLTRFILKGDKDLRDKGLKLRLRHNFSDLLAHNEAETNRGNWFPLMMIFDPRVSTLTPENAFWISAENEAGEIVACHAARIYHWPETTLADEARLMFFGGRDVGQECEVTTQVAQEISGWVLYTGALWARPDYRKLGLSAILPRMSRAYAATRWPVEWSLSFVLKVQVEKGVVHGYGYRHQDVSWSVKFSKSVIGDIETALIRMPAEWMYADLREYLEERAAKPAPAPRELALA